MEIIRLEKKIFQKNEEIAGENRELLEKKRIGTHNLIGSPGAGKTSIIERIIEYCIGKLRIGVIEGDCQTDRDAQRIKKHGVPVVQIVTEGGCHLIAAQVQKALDHIALNAIDILFIENVGNLVCPTNFDLGEKMKWVITSTTEGDDKPLKYPGIFRRAEVMVINKIDLLPYVECDTDTMKNNALSINPQLKIHMVSGKTGDGIDRLCGSLLLQKE